MDTLKPVINSRNEFIVNFSSSLEVSFPSIGSSDIYTQEDYKKLRNLFTLVDLMHHDQKRKTGMDRPYLDHIKDVVFRVVKNSVGNLDVSTDEGKSVLKKRITIALLHDLIEDTGVSYEIIKELFGEEIASSVQKLTKQSWILYCEKISQIQISPGQRKLLENVGISENTREIPINVKNFDDVKQTKIISLLPLIKGKKITIAIIFSRSCNSTKVRSLLPFFKEYNIDYRFQLEEERDEDMKQLLEEFQEYKEICRGERDKHYHGKLKELNEDELFVKLCDRESNLSDLEGMGIEKEVKMLSETILYYLIPLVQSKFPNIFKNIKKSVMAHNQRIKCIPDLSDIICQKVKSLIIPS